MVLGGGISLLTPFSRSVFKPCGLNNSATGNSRFPTPSLVRIRQLLFIKNHPDNMDGFL